MSDIRYGYVSKSGKCFVGYDIDGEKFLNSYLLQTPTQIMKSRVGVCWDQTELERYFFNSSIKLPFKVYYLECKNRSRTTHTALLYKKNSNYYWFENSWNAYKGIYKFKSEKDFLLTISKLHIDFENKYNKSDKAKGILVYQLNKPKYGISCSDFMNFAKSGLKILEF